MREAEIHRDKEIQVGEGGSGGSDQDTVVYGAPEKKLQQGSIDLGHSELWLVEKQ